MRDTAEIMRQLQALLPAIVQAIKDGNDITIKTSRDGLKAYATGYRRLNK